MNLSKQLRYQSPGHNKIENAIWRRLNASAGDMQKLYPKMAEAEELFSAYIKEQEVDRLKKSKKKTAGKTDYVTIELPYSYSILLTAHTYFTSVFLSRSPAFQYTARHGEVQESEQAVEALIDYQVNVGENLVPLFIWLLDPGKYGFGVVGMYWDEEIIRARRIVERPREFLGVPIPGTSQKVAEIIDTPGYQGNRLFNVRPQDCFPDTRVPLNRFQKGEFFGRYVEIGWEEIRVGEARGEYINVDVLRMNRDERHQVFGGDPQRDLGGRNSNLPVSDSFAAALKDDSGETGVVRAHEFYWRVAPGQWGLGSGDVSEIWVFTRTLGGVIIKARPLGCLHGRFPFAVLETEPDGYNLVPASMLGGLKPLNDVMSWLVNTHFYNVRASLNNQFVYDPTMIESADVENPAPGKMLRLKPLATGRDVRTMLAQLPVADVTRQHLGDLAMVGDMIQRMSGVNDNLMGMVNAGGRKTATEVRTSTTFGVNRLKTICEYFSAMGFSPLAQMMLQQSQQYYNSERKFKIVGDLSMETRKFATVTPEAIAGFYDFVPVDGTLPIDRFAQANLWQGLLGQLRNFPQIMMTYDVAKIFGYIATLAGLKNLGQFRVQLTPDSVLTAQAAAGNVIPMKGAGGAPTMPERMPQVQTPGMGQTI